MIEWEVLLTDGQVHTVTSVEPSIGDRVVRFYSSRNELVASYVLNNMVGWRPKPQNTPGGWPRR